MSRKPRRPAPDAATGDAVTGLPFTGGVGVSTLYELRLYTTGMTPLSAKAVANVRRLCETHLHGRYALEIVDIIQQPQMLREDQVLAAPTLIKRQPLPPRRFIGDMSRTEVILKGLDLEASDIQGKPES